jgi:adenine-specific DNA-methyltransferase
MRLSTFFKTNVDAVIFEGDCRDLLEQIPDNTVQLIITSPTYNVGKEYERKSTLDEYVRSQRDVIEQCVRVLAPEGSICWQVGNYVHSGAIVPLDTLLYPTFTNLGLVLRNRIIWHFEHGLHCSKRFSGRYETVNWFTKSDNYYFDLDPVRVPQKYPGKKYFKGPKRGQFSGNPLGKNPGDVWVIPNVKSNHVEKTDHPCQFPVELVERFVLSLTRPGDWVLDPFVGVGSSVVAAIRHGRRGMGAEVVARYVKSARLRVESAAAGRLRTRPMNTPVYDPDAAGNSLRVSPWAKDRQGILIEEERLAYREGPCES